MKPVWRSRTIQLFIASLVLFIMTTTPAGSITFAPGIEIIEVKNAGVSASDDAKSIIQVNWRAATQPGITIKSFEVNVEVTYADGAVEKTRTTVNGSARSARFEIPTVHFAAGKPAAELRGFKASIAASITETATKQGVF
ncbi:MAG: hypothetical protein AB1757_09745 [Acidobacteriota bacterium]